LDFGDDHGKLVNHSRVILRQSENLVIG
jgi:hypothetical protein